MKATPHAKRVVTAILAAGLTHRQARKAMARVGSKKSQSLWCASFRDLGSLLRLGTSGAVPWKDAIAVVDAAWSGTWAKVYVDGIDEDLRRLITMAIAYPGNRRAMVNAWVNVIGKPRAAALVADLRELVASADYAQPAPPPVKVTSPKAPIATPIKGAPKKGSYTQRLKALQKDGKAGKLGTTFSWDDWGPMR